MEKTQKHIDFNNKNRDKITKYTENIEVIGKKIPNNDFIGSEKHLKAINPKILDLWNVIGTGAKYGLIIGAEWHEYVNWMELFKVFEKEIIEMIEYFRKTYPIYFESIKF